MHPFTLMQTLLPTVSELTGYDALVKLVTGHATQDRVHRAYSLWNNHVIVAKKLLSVDARVFRKIRTLRCLVDECVANLCRAASIPARSFATHTSALNV